MTSVGVVYSEDWLRKPSWLRAPPARWLRSLASSSLCEGDELVVLFACLRPLPRAYPARIASLARAPFARRKGRGDQLSVLMRPRYSQSRIHSAGISMPNPGASDGVT